MPSYKPGDHVPESGVYSVVHDKNHHQPHDVTYIAGRKFPPCKNCEHPRFTLKLAAQHISDHQSFKH